MAGAREKFANPVRPGREQPYALHFCDAFLATFFAVCHMSYLVIARKYRPQTFSEVSGQEHVTRTLGNAIERGKVAHAYVFCGPRGVGKTSIARIFAKSLNCQVSPGKTPCLKCMSCTEIADGKSLAVLEIDGASHNSVDNVRELIESFRTAPPPGSLYKVYIIDEVHMLSTSAFNALLKSLEEPPPHTVFILATTEPHKIPDTVLSRCQVHNFRALSPTLVHARLAEVCAAEKLEIEGGALTMIARLSDGSMRDAQTLLDRVQSYCEGKITAQETSEILGAVEKTLLFDLSQSIFERNPAAALACLDKAFSRGLDPAIFIKDFVSHWRELLIAGCGAEDQLDKLGLLESEVQILKTQVAHVGKQDLQDLVLLAREGADSALRSIYPKYALEALVVRLASREKVVDLSELLGKLKLLTQAPRDNVSSASPKANGRAVSAAPVNTNHSLDWKEFVSFVTSSGAVMLGEQLKRISCQEFSSTPEGSGRLSLKGPEFTLDYLQQAENQAKLQELLKNYSKQATWLLDFAGNGSRGKLDPNSIKGVEVKEKEVQVKSQTRSLSAHPSIQSLKKVFPGSTIESIKIKNNQ